VQTYTHLTVGLVASQLIFPGDNVAQVVMVAATVVPDIPAAMQFAVDILKKKRPLAEQSKELVLVNSIFHSFVIFFFLWSSIGVLCMAGALPLSPVLLLAAPLGQFFHLCLDGLSHSGKEFEKTDPGMLWPLPWKVRGLFEYRTAGAGGLWTPLDLKISGAAIIIFVVLRFIL